MGLWHKSWLIVALALGGCAGSSEVPNGQPPPQGLAVQAQDTDSLEVQLPNVVFAGGVMTVRGRVHRKAAAIGEISGRMDIDLIGPDGKLSQTLTALLTPDPVPSEANGESGYVVYYGWIPPSGSTVKARFVDWTTAKTEDTHTASHDY